MSILRLIVAYLTPVSFVICEVWIKKLLLQNSVMIGARPVPTVVLIRLNANILVPMKPLEIRFI
jgi:hypothetical protein